MTPNAAAALPSHPSLRLPPAPLRPAGALRAAAAAPAVAVVGARAFLVSDGRGPLRPAADGPLRVDGDGYIVDRACGRLLGWPMRSDAQRLPRPAPLRATLTAAHARATRQVTVGLNLDSRLPVADAAAARSPSAWQHAFSITVYDDEGQAAGLVCGLHKTAADEWTLTVVDADGRVLPGTPWRLRFDADTGRIAAAGTAGTAVIVALQAQRIRLDFSAARQTPAPCAVGDLRQDGRDAQALHGVTIDSAGVVSAHYEGGARMALGRTRQPSSS